MSNLFPKKLEKLKMYLPYLFRDWTITYIKKSNDINSIQGVFYVRWLEGGWCKITLNRKVKGTN